MSTERLSDIRVAGMEEPLREMPGESIYAVRAPKMHTHRMRPDKWRGKEHGFIVHTTGSSLPERAHRNGLYPTVVAADHYFKSHGPHYVCGWRGFEGGDLLQIANEAVKANGVGTTEQRAAERDGTWTKKVKAAALKQWRLRHPGLKNPRGLLPKGAGSVNVCYIQMEMIPCVFWVKGKKFFGAEPMRKGLKFTEAQHDTAAYLACDIAERLEWPEGWQNSISRLGGHEDHTPISRTDRNGGWDPGGMRANPYFDWEYVISVIEEIL
jgi:hypothetical protein